jgi:hypothetical protein
MKSFSFFLFPPLTKGVRGDFIIDFLRRFLNCGRDNWAESLGDEPKSHGFKIQQNYDNGGRHMPAAVSSFRQGSHIRCYATA